MQTISISILLVLNWTTIHFDCLWRKQFSNFLAVISLGTKSRLGRCCPHNTIYLSYKNRGPVRFENWRNPRVIRYSHNILSLHRGRFSIIGEIEPEKEERQTTELWSNRYSLQFVTSDICTAPCSYSRSFNFRLSSFKMGTDSTSLSTQVIMLAWTSQQQVNV
jgi:hypothetical protein